MQRLGQLSVAVACYFAMTFAASAQTGTGVAPAADAAPLTPEPPKLASTLTRPGSTLQTQTVSSGTQTLEGRQLGEHVSGVAPEHPLEHGRHFGECVVEIALTGACSHEPIE